MAYASIMQCSYGLRQVRFELGHPFILSVIFRDSIETNSIE
ncbi:predicted protein [Sclerotinia sclerotiorum 1980 UF-70]|uniref:Uncharacterized protein n=1 Tax=Sclerotinia sclerotiorum (strain ATCC 18683 / 1980 / Ss-1) TaxID=665079 RepID=A7EE63_SCLS1|nr:predicted protein [Sclerotinia sclerotiorum 1980 UF-70]EDO01129.1 predicted protein [Sclerotinia sclerotiorum 1980 UF-70]